MLVAARADLAAADAVIKMCHHFDGRIPLNIVVLQGLFFLGQLLSLEDQPLPRRKRAFLFLNLDLNGRNGVRGFNIQGNVASRQGFDKDLHPALGKGRGRDQAQQQADGEQNTEQAFFYFGSSLSVSVNSYFICRAVKSRCMTESAIVRMSSAAMACRISEICVSGT